jgi:hypothetical protein
LPTIKMFGDYELNSPLGRIVSEQFCSEFLVRAETCEL